jgi:transposase
VASQLPLCVSADGSVLKNVLRHLFETVVERCMAEGLVGADGFAVDASVIAADANKQRSVPSNEWKPDEVKDKAC